MMLYLGIDLHLKQLTVCVRNEHGDVTLRRQVSTRPDKVAEFLEELRNEPDGYVAILEVCGFHDWLVQQLREQAACRDVVVIHPEKRSRKKTDRRDAHRLSEVLWVSRERLLAGERVQGVRRVQLPTPEERHDRQLTSVRQRLGRQRTRTLNQIHYLLRRHNLAWQVPTKTFCTQKVRQWLKHLTLPAHERRELDHLLAQWRLWDQQIEQVQARIEARFERNPAAQLLGTIVGMGAYMALAIASRVGDIRRFAHGRSLANFFGLTPGSRSSGETERLGSITKEGSRHVRFLLGQLVLHLLRKDGRMRTWYKRIKQRRGSKIARVAVMRRTAVIIWHMLSKQEAYRYGGAPEASPRKLRLARERAESEETQRRELREWIGRCASNAAATYVATPSTGSQSTGSSSLGAGPSEPSMEAVPCQA
jgi:transposase